MSRIRINALEVQGFKGHRFADGPVRFEFGETTLIMGENYQGKSSIGEAIIYALAGVDIDGKANCDAQLLNKDSNEMRVKVEFEVDGTAHEVERQVAVVKNKSQSTIILNRTKATQAHIDALIGDKKQLIAAFLPGYYCNLDPSEARAQLVPLLPIPSDEEIKAKLREDDPEAAEIIGDTVIMDTDFYIKQRNAELKEWQDEAKRLEGSADEIARALKEQPPELRDEEATRATVEALKEAIAAIRQAEPELEDTTALEKRRNELVAQYKAIQEGLDFDEKWVECPKCGERINLTAEQEAKNAAITKRMVEIEEEGKRVRAELDAMKKRNEQKLQQFQQENAVTLAALEAQLREAEEAHRAILEHNARAKLLRQQYEAALERSKTIAHDREMAAKNIAQQEAKIKAAKAYGRARVECQMDMIQRHLDRVRIRLFDVVKSTGEIKPTFKLEYDGKDYRRISKSEKMRCDLEISNLFRKLSGRDYPVFMDDGESITHFKKPDTQIIVAKVVPETPLTIIPDAEISEDGKIQPPQSEQALQAYGKAGVER